MLRRPIAFQTFQGRIGPRWYGWVMGKNISQSSLKRNPLVCWQFQITSFIEKKRTLRKIVWTNIFFIACLLHLPLTRNCLVNAMPLVVLQILFAIFFAPLLLTAWKLQWNLKLFLICSFSKVYCYVSIPVEGNKKVKVLPMVFFLSSVLLSNNQLES